MTTDTNLSQIVFNRLSNEKYHELKTSGKLDNEEFYITPDLDTNPGLIQDYISNAVIKIPQHINLELAIDGVLTLKAGSVVYVPNGFEEDSTTLKFDIINIQEDISMTAIGDIENSAVYLNIENNSLIYRSFNSLSSGTTDPQTPSTCYYNTETNKILDTSSGSVQSRASLPIAQAVASGGKFTEIKQVFNGIGYIGAVAFALPGIQAIIPNGFNKDSKLNNYTAVVERVLTKDYAADGLLGQNLPLTLTNSPLLSAGNMIYVEEENQMYKGSIAELSKRTEVEIAKVTTDSTRITSLTPLPVYTRILNSTQVYETVEENLNKKITNDLTANRVTYTNDSGIITTSNVTNTELNYLDGVTSNIQTQLNNKQATISGGASTITSSNLTASRALVSDGNGKVTVSAITSTELGYLDGVTSNIQTQLNDSVKISTAQAINGRKAFTDTPISNRELWFVDTSGTAPDNPPSKDTAYGTLRWIVKGTMGSTAGYGGGQELWRMQPILRPDGYFGVHTSYQYGTTKPTIFSFGCDKNGNNQFFNVPTPVITDNSTHAATTNWFNQKIQVVSTLPASPNSNVYYFVTNG